MPFLAAGSSAMPMILGYMTEQVRTISVQVDNVMCNCNCQFVEYIYYRPVQVRLEHYKGRPIQYARLHLFLRLLCLQEF